MKTTGSLNDARQEIQMFKLSSDLTVEQRKEVRNLIQRPENLRESNMGTKQKTK